MSKSLGNVADPLDFVAKYGTDALRYYLLSQISPFQDGDFSEKRLVEIYNSDLANGLGNLVARVAKLCETSYFKQTPSEKNVHVIENHEDYLKALNEYRFNDALSFIWNKISSVDKYINEEKPWELLKGEHPKHPLKAILEHAVDEIEEIAILLEPLLPETAGKIKEQFTKAEIKPIPSLFPRIA